jgi:hypothetical protein
MNTPNQKEKIKMYESFLHKINAFIVSSNNEGIKELVENADNWSYAHRIGNGEPSEKQQQQFINKAFWKLLDTPKTDKETQQRQKAYSARKKKIETEGVVF